MVAEEALDGRYGRAPPRRNVLEVRGRTAGGTTLRSILPRRTREIGVRRALGAQAVDVLRLVWGQAVVLTLLGAAVGLGVALAGTELLRPLLFGVAPREAGTLAALTALLLAVCAAASLAAAWRATRIDPLVALRESE
ncbi:MAG: FtsX-like permease family protein [Acidobacteria bacterium]|nr:FtsX-like permease family protein [Acidobacteriota bacterium]